MARATKKPANKKPAKKKAASKNLARAAQKTVKAVKNVTRKVSAKKLAVKKPAKKKTNRPKTVKATARSFVQSARVGAAAAAETGKGLIKRAIDTVVEVAKPLIPESTNDKPKDD